MLDVYRASAGSGKTHLLTGYYLTLLLRPDWTPSELGRPTRFEEVLAVTFTNKAAGEMKERIVAELHRLARQPRTSDYLSQIAGADASALDDDTVERLRQRADQLLALLLADYSCFSVSTIDHFFQRVVRAFMRELDLPSGYDVQLDEQGVFEAAVARFLANLSSEPGPDGRPNDEYQWVREFSADNIRNGKEWDVKRSLQGLANQLSSEAYQQHRESIGRLTADKAMLGAYRQRLRQLCDAFEREVRQTAEAAEAWIADHIPGGMDAFAGKSTGTMTAFSKWASGRLDAPTPKFASWADDATLWWKKVPAGVTPDDVDELRCRMQQMMRLFGKPYTLYNSAGVILPNLFQLGTLATIDHAVRDYCNEQSVVLLGRSNALLARLVADDDAPFVYAKVGLRYRSFMIDEFQDTSVLQWCNFEPLLREACASGQRNLIVGDVKQAIYRWRNSDWSLLQSGIYRSFAPAQLHVDTDTLRTNWRSLRAPVWFNNLFFPMAADQMAWNVAHRLVAKATKTKPATYADDPTAAETARTIADIYADVRQHYRPAPGGGTLAEGLVQIEYLEADKRPDYEEAAARRVPATVDRLVRSGFAMSDIAVLARTNRQCKLVAEALIAAGRSIISNKALRLDSDPAVGAVIAMMRHMQHPYDPLARAIAGFALYALADERGDVGRAIDRYFADMPEPKPADAPRPRRRAPAYLRPDMAVLAHRTLYEMTEELILLLPEAVRRRRQPFLQALRDQVLQFVTRHTPDLSAFLDWWDERGHDTTIDTPEGEDAIAVMTIHQAKGLGMRAVICPFANHELDIEVKSDRHANIIWCQPHAPELQVEGIETPAFPVRLSTKLADTDFADEYRHERLCSIIDELNTVYVAFTRAKEALIIYTPQSDPGRGMHYTLDSLLDRFRERLPELATTAPDHAPLMDIAPTRVTLGHWPDGLPADAPAPEATPEPAAVPQAPAPMAPDAPADVAPDESSAAEPAATDTDAPAAPHGPAPALTADAPAAHRHIPIIATPRLHASDPAIREGLDMHSRMERIVTLDDLTPADDDLRRLITADPLARTWYQPGMTIYTERDILLPDGSKYRPDRIMVDAEGRCTVVDFKTTARLRPGGRSLPGHERQVLTYMALLRQIGFADVRGYLWYLRHARINEVGAAAR